MKWGQDLPEPVWGLYKEKKRPKTLQKLSVKTDVSLEKLGESRDRRQRDKAV